MLGPAHAGPFVVRAVQIYVSATFQQASFLAPKGETFREFLETQDIFVFFVSSCEPEIMAPAPYRALQPASLDSRAYNAARGFPCGGARF